MKTDNELIAEFMGIKVSPVGHTNYDVSGKALPHEEDLEYDYSWDWLMPVVEKIRSHEDVVGIEISFSLGTICKICVRNRQTTSFQWLNIEDNGTINAVYAAVVEFIKYLNTQKQ
jgi:hypothetical protein